MCACAMCAWRLLLLAALPALVGVGGEVAEAGAGAGPEFLPTRRTVAAAPGGEAELACRVARLGDKAVSWVRARDLHILAHDGVVFSADPRVSAGVSASPSAARGGGGVVTHTLRLAPLRDSDAGRYECQLNTDPKLSQIYNLTVAERAWRSVEVEALSGTRVVGPAGGVATLACAGWLRPAAPAPAPDEPAPALRVTWLRDGEPLLPQGGALSGVSLDTERAAGRVTSRLTLAALAPAHSARYLCRVTAHTEGEEGEGELQGEVAITLLVMDDTSIGEMEAMQRDQSAAPGGAGGARAAPALTAALALAALRLRLAAAAR